MLTDSSRLDTELFLLVNEDEPLLTALSNAAALLYHSLERINWCGFYLSDGEKLVLGPFGGKPACTVIPMGKGVCGIAAGERRIVRIADVSAFPGHIACDPVSQSEIVFPLVLRDGSLFGVLDIDAPMKNRFSEKDERDLKDAVEILVTKIDAILEKNPVRIV